MNRCVLVAVLVLTASAVARADDDEDKAVERVEKLGGRVFRDEKKEGKPVVRVGLLHGTKVTAPDLKELAALKNLTQLNLSVTEVGDAELKELAALKNLTELNLWKSKVTDAGMKELKEAMPKCYIAH